ncbi:Gmad2 immunoglobulin-like domain-containing protein [Nocardioides nanhaiensis]|uniref:Bacterial spore germination immunoglobulin-like domain-containing protein n=1 Tax=Nocardioides nanhaiensis TaxID=1476871 RepID=A0ABP8WRT3_9ACTN
MSARPLPRTRARLAVLAVATSLALAGCGGSDDDGGTAEEPTSSAPASPSESAAEPSTPAETSEAPSESEDAGEQVAAPVYFVGDGPSLAGRSRGPVLFREFRDVDAADPVTDALELLLSGDALDPDYRSPLATPTAAGLAGTSLDGTGDQAQVTLELADDSLVARPAGMSAREARTAAQAVVYTVSGIAQARVRVFATLDGAPTTLFGVPTENGLRSAPELDVLNLVSVSDPAEGTTVSGSFTATGVGSSFEATIPWQVRRGEEVVLDGFTTAEGWIDGLYPWEAEVDVSGLEPGEYTFAAMTDDPTAGTEGFGPAEDTRTIVVE